MMDKRARRYSDILVEFPLIKVRILIRGVALYLKRLMRLIRDFDILVRLVLQSEEATPYSSQKQKAIGHHQRCPGTGSVGRESGHERGRRD